MNILFSDEFSDDFALLGDSANRRLLDSGTAGNDEHFWVRVQATFVEPDEEYDKLQFLEDDVFASQDSIDPGKIVLHEWKKLRSLWKTINAEYNAAVTHFTLSGTNESNFFDFCNGKLESYYLCLHLQLKPNLNDTVQADLPSECTMSSDQNRSDSTDAEFNNSRKKTKRNEVATAIKSLGNNVMRDNLAKHKMDYMTKDEVRRVNKERRRERDSAQNKQKRLFDEWQDIQSNLRILRSDLMNPNLTPEIRNDILQDETQLRKRKSEVANELGMTI
jgi:hypothetical protein